MPLLTPPSTIYYLRRKREDPKCNATQTKKEWDRCTDKKEREIVLREAFQICKEVATEKNVYDLLKRFPIVNVREYFWIELGLEKPPSRPYLYYQRKLTKLRELRRLNKDQKYYIKMKFNLMPFQKQLGYLKRFLDEWLGFFYKLKKIKNDDFFLKALTELGGVKFTNERRKSRVREKIRSRKFYELCMPHTRREFPDAPELPPAITPIQLFTLMLESEGGPRDETVVRRAFEKLPLIIQNSIEDKVIDFRKDFTTKLLNYVSAMTEAKRKLFLGLKRKYYFKLLCVDIFEPKYPNEKYPVYNEKSDATVIKAMKKNEEDSSMVKKSEEDSAMEISPSKDDDLSNSGDFDTFKLIDDSLLRLKNYGFQIDSSSDSDT